MLVGLTWMCVKCFCATKTQRITRIKPRCAWRNPIKLQSGENITLKRPRLDSSGLSPKQRALCPPPPPFASSGAHRRPC